MMTKVDRPEARDLMRRALKANPVVALLAPRQSGKTTLARTLVNPASDNYFDLENPRDAQRLATPMTALEPLRGLVVIDEVQRQPNLFEVLRVLADRRPIRTRFLLLGSASPELIQKSSESLAGRVAFIEMSGFSLKEVGFAKWRTLWRRGGFPDSFLARSEADSFRWRENFLRTFVEQDLARFGLKNPANMRRLWSILAYRHGQVFNGAEVSSSLGETYVTVKRHLDLLTGSYVVRQLPPWIQSLEKRTVRSPKIFIRDSGLLHTLLSLETARQIEGHPQLGASWEGFVVESVLRQTGDRNAYFWGTHAGAELDLFLQWKGKRIGVEVKWADAPSMTKSMHIALADLQLDALYVCYPGSKTYSLKPKVTALGLEDLLSRF